MAEIPATTEVGIDITNYTAEKAAGSVAIVKGAGGNYIYQRVTYIVQLVNGVPTAVPASQPALANINRGSIATLLASLDAQLAVIAARRAQISAIEADMNALDAIV